MAYKLKKENATIFKMSLGLKNNGKQFYKRRNKIFGRQDVGQIDEMAAHFRL